MAKTYRSKRYTVRLAVTKECREAAWELALLLYPGRGIDMAEVVSRAIVRTLRIAKDRQKSGKLEEYRKSFMEEKLNE